MLFINDTIPKTSVISWNLCSVVNNKYIHYIIFKLILIKSVIILIITNKTLSFYVEIRIHEVTTTCDGALLRTLLAFPNILY